MRRGTWANRQLRRLAADQQTVEFMAGANFDAAPSLAEAMGLEEDPTMHRIVLTHWSSWGPQLRLRGASPYSAAHCCVCGRPVKEDAVRLCVSRTDDGEWWVCDPSEPVQADEQTFGRFALPIGPFCRQMYPEFVFGIMR